MKKLVLTTIALSWIALLFFGCGTNENKNVPVSLKWRYKTGLYQKSYPFPTVVDGVVYDGNTKEYLYALYKDTGELKWKFYEKKAVFSSPSVAYGVVYVGKRSSSPGNNKSYLYAIDASSGKLKWRVRLSVSTWHGPPTVSDGIVYIGSANRSDMMGPEGKIQFHLYAIDAVSGETQWRYKVEGGILQRYSPLVVDDTVFFGGEDHRLYAVDAKSGELKWRFWTEDLITSFPSVVDGIVYTGTWNGVFFAIDASNGGLKWQFETGYNYPVTSPVVVNGVAYVGSLDSYFYAIDTDSGTLKWRFKTEYDIVSTSPFVVNDSVYFGSGDNYLYALNVNNGVLKWKYNAGDSIIISPIIIVDDIIYFKTRDGYFYALEIKKNN